MGVLKRGKWFYWGYPLTRYNLSLQAGRRILNRIRLITAFVFWLNCWIWAGFLMYKQELLLNIYRDPIHWRNFIIALDNRAVILFWLGVIGLLYLWYRIIRQKELVGAVEPFKYNEESLRNKKNDLEINSWEQAIKLPGRKKHNIANAFTEEALSALAKAYRFADKNGAKEVSSEHLFFTLLTFNRISNIFIRLGIPASSLQKELEPLFPPLFKEGTKGRSIDPTLTLPLKREGNIQPFVSKDFQQIIFQAYETAYNAHQDYVSVTELLVTALQATPKIQEILFNFNISERELTNVVEWARMREKLRRQYVKFKRAASHHSKYGMDKAMTALATPYLNSFSSDITMLAHFGQLNQCVARSKEIEEVYQVIDSGEHNVMLVGEHGVGKKTVVEGIAQSMIEDDVPARLKDKRLVRLSVSALLAGTSPAGAVERLRNIMQEMSRARNVILFIHNIHELVGVSAGESGSLDIAGTLAEFLSNDRFLTIATTTPEDYSQHILNSSVKDVFTKVEIPEMNEDQAIQVLESRAGILEYKQNVFFSYDAIAKSVEFAVKFIHEAYLPGNALEIMTESATYTHNKKGNNSIVTKEEVAAVVTAKTKIPLSAISSDESGKLMRLEEEMHERVIGQDEGVTAVANALRRARAEMRSAKRPIANFLFLGPTGVGKTELAKTIAEVYFGGESRMIRLDMSEYQDKNSIYRLIGMPGEKGTGVLTEAVRRNPFSLLLLDEIEKADPDVLNLFLQVMDDGRLSDTTGHVYDFTNVILIATSNAGTAYVQEQNRNGVSHEVLLNQLLHGELKQYFKPEFLNRFDGIILFNPLSRPDIKQIAGLMFARIAKSAEEKGVRLKATDEALEFLADVGYDPEFGARPMRRALQEKVENKLAELFLQGKLKRGSTVTVGAGGEIVIE
ncbi:MAG: ATPase AAA-2 domain protein [Candidatus Magasanikbacteria bacterium GW2011_GWA2_40_10]|uniref:ATPase AAA-2 domain protein n=1 Tax=Candidatus Magasanikbacteria bacterium GW2011_GWA2_40_10 TaxID=1619037 RepID=A0A0G0T9D0_9BACT|nr:MAG: ATPase AAA-2 domain protein [Candidatus Magasanikbacteria bacterium GW2011_GWA2_40_10]